MKVCIILALVACVAAVRLNPADVQKIKVEMLTEMAKHNLPAEIQAQLIAKIIMDPSLEAKIHELHQKVLEVNPEASLAERCFATGNTAFSQLLQALLNALTTAPTAAPTTAAPTPAPGRR